MPNNRQAAGWAARATGAQWELEFDERLRSADILSLPQHPEVRHVGKDLGLRVVGAAYVDRVLLCSKPGPSPLRASGAVTELKSTMNRGRYRIEKGKGASSTQKQFYNMVDAARRGIPAFYTILWRFDELIEIFPVTPLSVWPVTVVKGMGFASWDRDDGLWPYKLRRIVFEDNGLSP